MIKEQTHNLDKHWNETGERSRALAILEFTYSGEIHVTCNGSVLELAGLLFYLQKHLNSLKSERIDNP